MWRRCIAAYQMCLAKRSFSSARRSLIEFLINPIDAHKKLLKCWVRFINHRLPPPQSVGTQRKRREMLNFRWNGMWKVWSEAWSKHYGIVVDFQKQSSLCNSNVKWKVIKRFPSLKIRTRVEVVRLPRPLCRFVRCSNDPMRCVESGEICC